jgi:alpha-1,3-mannosyltransferase
MHPAQRPLRIVHVVRQYEPSRGGLEDFVKCLSRQQRADGHRVEILTLNREFQAPAVQLEPMATINGIKVNRIGFVGNPTYFVARGILGRVADADIVHVHATDFFFDFLAVCRPFIRARLVCTTHGGFFHTQRLLAVKKLYFRTLTRLFLRAYDRVVACSDSDYRLFAAACGDRLMLIDNGVDIEKLRDSGARTLTKTIVTLGRFSANKRVSLLIERFAELAGDDPEWRLRICGVNSDETAEGLVQRAQELGVVDRVAVHVGLSDAGIREVMAEASFFVSASRYEGFGLAAVEAMSAGLQPILHANEAYKALAAKHARIILVDFAVPGSLAAAAQEAHERLSRGFEGSARAISDETSAYGWGRVAGRYQAVYDDLLVA